MKLLLADPILTPLIVSGLGAIGLGGGIALGPAGIGVAAIAISATQIAHVLSFVIVAGISVGLYALTAPPVPKAENGKLPVQETVAPRQYCYGVARISGTFMLRETNTGAGGNLCTIMALTSHLVNGFRHIYLNDNRQTFGGGNPLPATPAGQVVDTMPDNRYKERVFICLRYGVVPETRIAMFDGMAHPLDAALWPATARGDGCAQLGMRCNDAGSAFQAEIYPYGAPNPSAVVEGYKVFDPRLAPPQIPGDETTYAFSRNPALCILHYLCFSEFGFNYPYSVAIAPVVSEWIIAADACGDLIPTLSGVPVNIRRYELGGFATTANEQKAVLRLMLDACDGWLVRRGDGSCLLRVGKFAASGVEINDEHIIGFSYQNGISDEDAINRLDVQLTSQDHDWTQVECDPWDNNPDQISRGHVRESMMNLEWVQDYRIARRLAKREFVRQKEPLRGTLDLKLSALNAAYERWIYVSSNLIPALSNRYIENRASRFVLAGDVPSIHMEFIGVDPAKLEDWTPANEGKAPPAVHDGVPGLAPEVPVISAITPLSSGADRVLQIDHSTGSDDDNVPIMQIRWRIKTPTSEWVRRDTAIDASLISAGTWRIGSEGVPESETLEVQVRRILTRGTRTDWSPIFEVIT
jgi:hypothetical protein